MKLFDFVFGAFMVVCFSMVVVTCYGSHVAQKKYEKDVRIAQGLCHPYKYETYFKNGATGKFNIVCSDNTIRECAECGK